MMKSYTYLALAAALGIVALPQRGVSADSSSPLVYDTAREVFSSSDFDGDGRVDVVIVDKETGKFRLGYQQASGAFNWVDCRFSGLKVVGGVGLGKLLKPNLDALAFAAPDANQLTIVDASSSTAPSRPVVIAFTAGLGPNTVIPVDVGGAGNTPVPDLFVGSIYNSPDPNQATLLRNDGKEFPRILDAPLAGAAVHGNHVPLKSGVPDFAAYVVNADNGDTLRIEDFSSGKPAEVATVPGLPSGSDYTFGRFRGAALPEFVLYKPGAKELNVRPLEESGGSFKFAAGSKFQMDDPVRRVITLNLGSGLKLFVIFADGTKAGLFDFDGAKAPVAAQGFTTTNEFTYAAATANGLVILAKPMDGKFSTRYELWNAGGATYTAGAFGGLSSLADNDNITIPDIHNRIVSKLEVKEPAQMQKYTNTIPGTRVTYVMVPIPGGEFAMGSPDKEADRNADEGPQHKVKIDPFWMGQYEITWNEYELFMYPDEEKRTRTTVPTDAGGDKLADAVTHPSKPYVEMSFGMGKDGYPAISMTQHAANKYCQWLSAKTGQFYRLPTEAEWEYACRAGTTTLYSFGDDVSKLPEYGWFEQNSDFKYQKVGKKKPNPWGLYDMHGNVVEWVLDQYDSGFYKQCSGQALTENPWNKATKAYPHAVRGGSWDDEAKKLRSAARRGSDRQWKMQDPQLPKSVWYFSDAQWVGFRVVRPLKVPPPEELQKYWTSGVERD
jgi:formylglycine-generating enzyme required for sulfatase activity